MALTNPTPQCLPVRAADTLSYSTQCGQFNLQYGTGTSYKNKFGNAASNEDHNTCGIIFVQPISWS